MSFGVADQSNIHDFKLAAEACFPMISAVIAEIKNQTYPGKCFLNITLATDIVNHKVNFELACLSLCHFNRWGVFDIAMSSASFLLVS